MWGVVVVITMGMAVDPLTPLLPLLCPRNVTSSVIVPRNPVVVIVIHSVATVFLVRRTSIP